MAQCKFCQKEIFWTKEGRKNVPVDPDGGTHRCEEMKKTLSSVKVIDPKSLPKEEIERMEAEFNKPKKKR